jgi:CRISPR-associated endonuclease Cas3-HD
MFIANSHQQPLIKHLKTVGLAARSVAESLCLTEDILHRKFNETVEMAGLFHDFGKVDPNFVSYITKDESYSPDTAEVSTFALNAPLHHEWSLLAVIACWKDIKQHMNQNGSLDRKKAKSIQDTLKYAVYWHHAEQKRDISNLQTLMTNSDTNNPELLPSLAAGFNVLGNDILNKNLNIDEDKLAEAIETIKSVDFIDVGHIRDNTVDKFKHFKDVIMTNAIHLLARYCVITGDRYISSLSVNDMSTPIAINQYQDDNLLASISDYIELDSYKGERTEAQKRAAFDLASCDTNTLVGPAGCGKTRVALMDYYYSRTKINSEHKGIVWLVPRVVVGLGVLSEIRAECPDIVVSIVSGEHKKCYRGEQQLEGLNLLDADIVIMTIDQVAKRLTSHKLHDEFGLYLHRFVVFDEYHELFNIPTLYWIVLILMQMKELQTNGHRFISATPEPFHLRLIGRSPLTSEEPIVLDSFNNKPININFSSDYQPHDNGTINIFNSAKRAQLSTITAHLEGLENIHCFHSKFSPPHRENLTEHILSHYGKGNKRHANILFAGPAAQAALNISAKHLNTEITSGSNAWQRLGRNNRFAEFEEGSLTIIVNDQLLKEQKGSYGYYGFIKDTGVYKYKITENNFIPTRKAHFSETNYKFYREILRAHGVDNTKPMDGSTIQSDMNRLLSCYLGFWKKELLKSEDKLGELFDYVIENARILERSNFYKPVKYIRVDKDTGAVEAVVSYRGSSTWATMNEISLDDNHWTVKGYVASDESPQNLISIASHDYSGIDTVSNISEAPFAEVKKLSKSLKYRAQALGQSTEEYLAMTAKNIETPLICSNEKHLNDTSLFYVTINKNESLLPIGYLKAGKGLSELKSTLNKEQ